MLIVVTYTWATRIIETHNLCNGSIINLNSVICSFILGMIITQYVKTYISAIIYPQQPISIIVWLRRLWRSARQCWYVCVVCVVYRSQRIRLCATCTHVYIYIYLYIYIYIYKGFERENNTTQWCLFFQIWTRPTSDKTALK